MNTFVKVSFIIIAILIVLGLVFSVIAGVFFTKDIKEFFNMDNAQRSGVEKTITMSAADFKKLDTQLINANVTIMTEDTDTAKITYKQFDDEKIEEINSNGTFGLLEKNKYFFFNFKNWFRINTRPVTIIIPSSVKVDAVLSIVNGKMNIGKSVYTSLKINAVNGAITLNQVTSDSDIFSDGVNGETKLSDIVAKNKVKIETVNGKIYTDSISAGVIDIDTVNGGIEILKATCPDISCETVNGSIKASIYGEMNDYNISHESVNGNIFIDGSKYGKDININRSKSNRVKFNTVNGKAELSFIKQ